MNQYYEVVGTLDGTTEDLYGSFLRTDCTDELDSEKDSWRADGYKDLRIVCTDTNEVPDPEIYKADIVTKKQLFQQQAPSFAFELNADQLVVEGLERGFITKIAGSPDSYLINRAYVADYTIDNV